MLVRTWNVFHGNTNPPGRVAFLERMVRLAVEDEPDVVCLQEVPVWALERLHDWSGMTVFPAVTEPPRIGPFRWTAGLGRRLTAINPGLFRSSFQGQANAVLAAPALAPVDAGTIVLNPASFRKAQARRLALGLVPRLAWASERRVCQGVRVTLADGRTALVANLHATAYAPDRRLAEVELLRAATFADGLAGDGDAVVLAGDFNLSTRSTRVLHELAAPDWGFSAPGPGLDHVLARSLKVTDGPAAWPDGRRRYDGQLLSDHAPVDVRLG